MRAAWFLTLAFLSFVAGGLFYIGWRLGNGVVGALPFPLLAGLVWALGYRGAEEAGRLRGLAYAIAALCFMAAPLQVWQGLRWERKRSVMAAHAQRILDARARFRVEHGRAFEPGEDGPDEIPAWLAWGERAPVVQTNFDPKRGTLSVRNTFATGDYWVYSPDRGWEWPDVVGNPELWEQPREEVEALLQGPAPLPPIPPP